jgi:hypothetical protein
VESADFNRALGMFSQSQEPFDLWFKQRLAAVSGVDLGNLPPGMQLPELVSSYEAQIRLRLIEEAPRPFIRCQRYRILGGKA